DNVQETQDKTRSDVERSAPSAWEVKERLKAESRNGPKRPLEGLARTEVVLGKRSEILSELPEAAAKDFPTPEMLINRIIDMVDLHGVPLSFRKKLRREIISLYRALAPIDATDSMFVQLMIAMHLSAMQALLRGARYSNSGARVVNYRHAENATKS